MPLGETDAATCNCLTPAEIAAAGPVAMPEGSPLEAARARMQATNQWHPWQSMGRRWSIGCVALEITQRCNLDCTLCYLSESSEAVKDVPIEELFRRMDGIRAQYGPDTDLQVTGGDPTLRKREELVEIVRYARRIGLRPSLFTNGIKATRDLLAELCEAGLVDVAFHVDLTQERKGYATEVALNAVRAEYIARARGLPLSVFFNTTVFDGNFAEIPEVAAFFVRNADAVNLASFQLQAETGRGTAGVARAPIRIDTVAGQISAGAGSPISFEKPLAGHTGCNRYAMTLVANGRVHDLYDDPRFLADILAVTAGTQFSRHSATQAVTALAGTLLRQPGVLGRMVPWVGRKLWRMRRDLLASRGRAHKLSFFIHDFMDACHLDRERIEACVFMVQTGDGPVSMCLHNAKRDAFILKPLQVTRAGGGTGWWNPLTGKVEAAAPGTVAVQHTRKTAKGRVRVTRVPARVEARE